MFEDYFNHKLLKLLHRRSIKDKHPLLAIPSNDYIGQAAVVSGYYKNDILSSLMQLLTDNTISGACVDVGANIGNHAMFFASHFSQVLAFEQNPLPHRFLKLNQELSNGVITSHQLALSDKSGTTKLATTPFNLGKSKVSSSSKTVVLEIKTERFDNLAIDFQIGLIKIDIEGHELEVLRGMQSLITNQRPLLAVETKLPNFELTQLLSSAGYKYYYTVNTPSRRSNGCFKYIWNELACRFSKPQPAFV